MNGVTIFRASDDAAYAQHLQGALSQARIACRSVDINPGGHEQISPLVQGSAPAAVGLFLITPKSDHPTVDLCADRVAQTGWDLVLLRTDPDLPLPGSVAQGRRVRLLDSVMPATATAPSVILMVRALGGCLSPPGPAVLPSGLEGPASDRPRAGQTWDRTPHTRDPDRQPSGRSTWGPSRLGRSPDVLCSTDLIEACDENEQLFALPIYLTDDVPRPPSRDQALWWKQVHKLTTRNFPSVQQAYFRYRKLARPGECDFFMRTDLCDLLNKVSSTFEADISELLRPDRLLDLGYEELRSVEVLRHIPLCLRILARRASPDQDIADMACPMALNLHLSQWVHKINVIADAVIEGYLSGLSDQAMG